VIGLYLRGETERQTEVVDSARVEGATLAARTMQHQLGNRLSVTMGYSELLADDPRLPEDLGEQVHKIIASARAALEAVDKLRKTILRVELDTKVAGPPLLDLDASTAPDSTPTPAGRDSTH
jgi:signal transduction histidine kinase